jgi:phosphoglycerate dehydrogenase-like enzyme
VFSIVGILWRNISREAETGMMVLTHRLFDAVSTFRAGSWSASPMFGGFRHGEVLGSTLGIIGYGRIGREVAGRAAGIKCRVLAANRSPGAEPAPAETVYPLAELDHMLPRCDTVLIACALAPETRGLIDARRLALLKPGALLINVARAPIVDEDALYDARCVVEISYRRRAGSATVAPPVP